MIIFLVDEIILKLVDFVFILNYFLTKCMWIILLLLILIFFCWWRYTGKRKHRALIQKSSGIFDEDAQEALKILDSIPDPTPQERVERANIRRFNILEGRVNNPRIVRDIIGDYRVALAGMTHAPIDNHEFVLQQIGDFNNTLIAAGQYDFNTDFATYAPAARVVGVGARLNAAATAPTREDAIAIALTPAYTNDPQNAHDSGVNANMRRTIAQIRGACDATAIRKEIEAYIGSADVSSAAKTAARQTLQMMGKNNVITAVGDTEDNILAYVWERSKHPRNARMSGNIRDAVVQSLADSVENDNVVCVNGRCARIVGSLATLDYDDSVGALQTFEAYRNQIYKETNDIVEAAIARAKESADPVLRKVGEAYSTGAESDDPGADQTFKDAIKDEVDKNIDAYASKMTPVELDNLRAECHVYATL